MAKPFRGTVHVSSGPCTIKPWCGREGYHIHGPDDQVYADIDEYALVEGEIPEIPPFPVEPVEPLKPTSLTASLPRWKVYARDTRPDNGREMFCIEGEIPTSDLSLDAVWQHQRVALVFDPLHNQTFRFDIEGSAVYVETRADTSIWLTIDENAPPRPDDMDTGKIPAPGPWWRQIGWWTV